MRFLIKSYLYVGFLLIDEQEFPFIIADWIDPCYPVDDWFFGFMALEKTLVCGTAYRL
jgi:hypothetical protein